MIPENKKIDYEKIKTDDFVLGTISDVIYDKDHLFKGFAGNPDTTQVGVRLVFSMDEYKFPHKTPWMKFSYSPKANIFKKYVVSLVEGAEEYFEFDLDQLKGMRVKTLWTDNGEYQNIETIRPADGKRILPLLKAKDKASSGVDNDDEVSF